MFATIPIDFELLIKIVLGWPTDKPSQKILALELAAAARFVPKPMDAAA